MAKKIKLKTEAEMRKEMDAMPDAARSKEFVPHITEHISSRLRVNMIIELKGIKYRVDMVNACRARCVPMEKVKVVVRDKLKDKEVTFERTAASIDISPNSECPIHWPGNRLTSGGNAAPWFHNCGAAILKNRMITLCSFVVTVTRKCVSMETSALPADSKIKSKKQIRNVAPLWRKRTNLR